MKKRLLSLVVAGAMVVSLMAGCSSSGSNSQSGQKTTVNFWAEGSDNVRIAMEAVAKAFNESENGKKYNMVVQFVLSGTGGASMRDRMVAEYKANQKSTGFDVMETSVDNFVQYTKQAGGDIFMKLDKSKVSNFSSILAKPTSGDGYVMPYRGTTVVIAYNSDVVKTPPKTADELTAWIKAHPGRFAYNDPGTGGAGSSFVQTAIYNKISDKTALTSDDPKWKDQWDAGFKYLAEIHPYLYKASGKVLYPNKNQGTLDLLANKEVDMIPAWADMTLTQLKAGSLPKSIKICQIDPALTGNLSGIFIPTMSTNVEGAYAVMNFFATPEVQNILLDQMAAIPLIDQSKLNPDNAKLVADLKIDNFRLTAIGALGTDLNKRWTETIATLPSK